MIIGKIKQIIRDSRSRQNLLINLSKEIEWAHIYHDTIRGRKWLEDLAICPGRMAGNYSFFYILTKVLGDFKPQRIIEFGLGESSKVISAFIENEIQKSTHLIIEQSTDWILNFNSRFALCSNSNVLNFETDVEEIKGYPVNVYRSIKDKIVDVFDFYVIDGPIGSDRYSRYDICSLAESLKSSDEFIILIDDYDRLGEQDTVRDLLEILTKRGIKTNATVYEGNKAQIVIATSKYRFITSI